MEAERPLLLVSRNRGGKQAAPIMDGMIMQREYVLNINKHKKETPFGISRFADIFYMIIISCKQFKHHPKTAGNHTCSINNSITCKAAPRAAAPALWLHTLTKLPSSEKVFLSDTIFRISSI